MSRAQAKRVLAADALGAGDGRQLLHDAIEAFREARSALRFAGLEAALRRKGQRQYVFAKLRRGGTLRVYLDPTPKNGGAAVLIELVRARTSGVEPYRRGAEIAIWQRVCGDMENTLRAILLFDRARRYLYELAEQGTRFL